MRALGWCVGTALLFGVFAYVILELPEDLISPRGLEHKDLVELRNDVRTTGIQLVGGAVLALGTLATAWNAIRVFRLSQDGQAAERFTRAVEQLGADKQDLRLGGIHSLERLAEDSQRDRTAVAQILAAYLRQHAPVKGGGRSEPPPADVQLAVAALGRRRAPQSGDQERLDLAAIDLGMAQLQDADLADANIAETSLRGAFLDRADLARVNLTSADLKGARLSAASLRDANLMGAVLDNAYLEQADLRGANLTEASLRGANLRGAQGAETSGAVTDPRTRLP